MLGTPQPEVGAGALAQHEEGQPWPVEVDTGPVARLLAHRQRGARPGPLACDAADVRALIDQGELAYRAPWLTITAAGRRSLQSPA